MFDRFGLDLPTLVALLTGIAAFATVVSLALPFLRRNEREARLKAIAKRREELSQQQKDRITQERTPQRGNRKKTALMTQILKKVNLQELAASKDLRQKLTAAGYRDPSAPVVFLFVRLGAMVGLTLLGLFFITIAKEPVPLFNQILWIGGGVVAGFFFPPLMVKNKAQKRQEEMVLHFPDTLDLLVICTESGLSIEASFARVTEEIAESSPVLSEELGLVTAELAFLGDRRAAYNNFSERTGLQPARTLATALIQSEKYGTPVSQALKVLANENRQERMARAEKKAGSLPAQLTVPMIVFFLPALFTAIIGPAIIQIIRM